ncbi:hypothetical protein V8J88_25310 [Massilia sp. W12]|uniref:hypothetical protein n=1 Tax=Massilia sp. W12 TaxID=3126507 RepID=UPI0030CC2D41
MSQSLIKALEEFTAPHDETQLRKLEKAISAARPEELALPEFKALLRVFERFPEDDGYGIFWSILHRLEACKGYEPALIASVKHAPGTFNLLMLNRLHNGGIAEVDGQSLLSMLAAVAANPAASGSARQSAQDFISYQNAKRNTDA